MAVYLIYSGDEWLSRKSLTLRGISQSLDGIYSLAKKILNEDEVDKQRITAVLNDLQVYSRSRMQNTGYLIEQTEMDVVL